MHKTQLLIRITGGEPEGSILTVCGNRQTGKILFQKYVYVFGEMLCDASPLIRKGKGETTECILTLKEGDYFLQLCHKTRIFSALASVKENSCNIVDFHISEEIGAD